MTHTDWATRRSEPAATARFLRVEMGRPSIGRTAVNSRLLSPGHGIPATWRLQVVWRPGDVRRPPRRRAHSGGLLRNSATRARSSHRSACNPDASSSNAEVGSMVRRSQTASRTQREIIAFLQVCDLWSAGFRGIEAGGTPARSTLAPDDSPAPVPTEKAAAVPKRRLMALRGRAPFRRTFGSYIAHASGFPAST
jgi:hypothetical protein